MKTRWDRQIPASEMELIAAQIRTQIMRLSPDIPCVPFYCRAINNNLMIAIILRGREQAQVQSLTAVWPKAQLGFDQIYFEILILASIDVANGMNYTVARLGAA